MTLNKSVNLDEQPYLLGTNLKVLKSYGFWMSPLFLLE